VTHFLIPYRFGGKTRLGDPDLALAMLSDVTDAVNALGEEALIVDGPGGQGEDVVRALATLPGPVTIVNGDVPCVTAEELDELTRRAPAIVAARDGTTNAIAILDRAAFAPL
jgi:2-phospho-L-lactate guanylyltransferase (CobY/MobA/RfbA family)